MVKHYKRKPRRLWPIMAITLSLYVTALWFLAIFGLVEKDNPVAASMAMFMFGAVCLTASVRWLKGKMAALAAWTPEDDARIAAIQQLKDANRASIRQAREQRRGKRSTHGNTGTQIALCEFFYGLAMACGALFVIALITNVVFLGMIALVVGLPSYIISSVLANHVDDKRRNYYYWRHYNKWK